MDIEETCVCTRVPIEQVKLGVAFRTNLLSEDVFLKIGGVTLYEGRPERELRNSSYCVSMISGTITILPYGTQVYPLECKVVITTK